MGRVVTVEVRRGRRWFGVACGDGLDRRAGRSTAAWRASSRQRWRRRASGAAVMTRAGCWVTVGGDARRWRGLHRRGSRRAARSAAAVRGLWRREPDGVAGRSSASTSALLDALRGCACLGPGARRPPRAGGPELRLAPGHQPQNEKEGAAPTWKRGFGFHPLLCYLDPKTGRGAGRSAARGQRRVQHRRRSHREVLKHALEQLPARRCAGWGDLARSEFGRAPVTTSPPRWPRPASGSRWGLPSHAPLAFGS